MENYFITLLEDAGISTIGSKAIFWTAISACILLLFYISALICRKVVTPLVRLLTSKTQSQWDDILLNDKTIKNICSLIPATVIAIVLPFIVEKDNIAYTILSRTCWAYMTILTVILACTLLSAIYTISNESEKTKNHTLQGVFQMLKIIAICVGAIIIVAILIDKDPTKLLAGLGASAAVLMLVFKDSIMGLVAGVQLSANDMLRPGDWITMPKYGADGYVTEVTLTTVKVQNWDKTITTVPPYALVSDSFQNWRGMFNSGGRRIKRSIFIDMNTIRFCDEKMKKDFVKQGFIKAGDKNTYVNLTLFREWLEAWLRNHKEVHKEMIVMVRQLQPTPQGLPIELYFFSADTAWVSYEHLQAEIFEYIFAVLPEFKLRAFQSPAGSDFK